MRCKRELHLPALLLASKQIHQEAVDIYWKSVIVYFPGQSFMGAGPIIVPRERWPHVLVVMDFSRESSFLHLIEGLRPGDACEALLRSDFEEVMRRRSHYNMPKVLVNCEDQDPLAEWSTAADAVYE